MRRNKRSRRGIATFSRIQTSPSRAKYLVSARTIVDSAVKAFEAVMQMRTTDTHNDAKRGEK